MNGPEQPLTANDLEEGLEVAVYIPDLTRPLFGEIVSWRYDETYKTKVRVHVWRAMKEAMLEVDVETLEGW